MLQNKAYKSDILLNKVSESNNCVYLPFSKHFPIESSDTDTVRRHYACILWKKPWYEK